MKKILLFINVCFIFYMATLSGCNCGETPTGIEIVPTPSPELVYSNMFDSTGSPGSLGGLTTVTQTTNITPQLAFDRDSIRITYSYKGASTSKDSLFYIYSSTGRLYTLKDNSATDTYKNVDTIFKSPVLTTFFSYTIQARADAPYIAIKDLKIYKK